MAGEWNEFVRTSRNATFLFDRGYMDYHADRFADCSWMVWKKNRPVAILPANIDGDGVMHSHGGLTYGGWLLPPAHIDGSDLLSIFSEGVGVWLDCGYTALDYKPIPYIYASAPSQEDEYALFRLGARLTECNLSATIDNRLGWNPNKLQRRHFNAALRAGFELVETADVEPFMCMLTECLRERHGVCPVHSGEELQLLRDRFPENIRIHLALADGEPQAGVCVYDTPMTAHAQYIATSLRGRELNLLTPLFHQLISDIYASRRYFDFGICNEEHGLYLNAGLLRQKCSYGASGTVYSRYLLEF